MRTGILLAAAACGGLLWLLSGGGTSRAVTAEETVTAEQGGVADGEYGTITGQFVLDGEIPARRVLVPAGSTQVNNPAICAAANILSDELVVDPKTQGIANAFVYLPKAEKVH